MLQIFLKVHRTVSKTDNKCIISVHCIWVECINLVEKQLLTFWHAFVLLNIKNNKKGFQKKCNKKELRTVIKK